jgi:TonB family protein
LKLSVERVLAWVASIVVVIACGIALVLMDPPGAQRQRKLDERRVSDLKLLDTAIQEHVRRHDALPKDLASLEVVAWLEPRLDDARDPETGKTYGYERVDATRYRLCADFAAKSRNALHPDSSLEWAHPAGRHCFDRDRRIDPAAARAPMTRAEPPVATPIRPSETRPPAVMDPSGNRVASPAHQAIPRYPSSSIRRREQGEVLMTVEVREDGTPGEVMVKKSSGYKPLDDAAVEAMKSSTFHPALVAGDPRASTLEMPLRFSLNSR